MKLGTNDIGSVYLGSNAVNAVYLGTNLVYQNAPVATAATGIGQTSFTANWNAYTGAVYYLLDVSTSSSFTTFVYENQVVTSTSYVVIGLNSNTTYYYRVRASTEGDADALSFVSRIYTAGGTISYTEFQAVNTLVGQMKTDGIWTKMKAIYPMVGASAAACAQNLKSSSFTGVFSSGWTFASTGVTPNGTSAYMDTNLNDNTSLNLNDIHFSVYLRTNSDGVKVDLGVFNQTNSGVNIFPRLNNLQYTRLHDEDLNTIATTDSRGFRLGIRNSSSSKNVFINNAKTTFSQNSVIKVPLNIYIGASNHGIANQFSDRQNAFASIGDGLTDTEASDFYTAVQAFQTTLSRNV